MSELLEMMENNESFRYYFGITDENEALDAEEFDDDDDDDDDDTDEDDEEESASNPEDTDEDEEALNLPDSPTVSAEDLPEEKESDE